MTALIDGRPGGLDAQFRPGNVFPVDFVFPDGEMAGRSFVASLDGVSLDVAAVGDVLTVTVSAAQTAAANDDTGLFRLTETTGGGSQDVIVGTWKPSISGAVSPGLTVNVSTDAAQVAVSVAAAVASPEVVHDWTVDGWTPWRTQLVSDDDGGAVLQSLSVVGDEGRITNTGVEGNVRVAYERLGTEWENSEVCCLWLGGSIFDSGTALPQMGQFHRAYIDEDGRWRAIVITNNIFLSDPNVVNQNVWNHDPAGADQDALDLGANGGSRTFSAGALGRTLQVRAVSRVDFFGWLNQYVCEPRHAYGLQAGDQVTIDVTDATFDQATAAAVASVDTATGTIAVVEPTTLSPVAAKFEQGVVTPTSASARRWWPYWVKSQLVDAVLRVKVWRYMDTEPDWSDTAHVVTQDFTLLPPLAPGVAGTPEPDARMPEGVGRCGLVGAHLRNSAFMRYGHFSARKL